MVKHYGWQPLAFFHHLLRAGYTRLDARVTVLVIYSRDTMKLRKRLERLHKEVR